VPFWWHSIDLGHGVVTKGEKSPALLTRELASLRLPPLSGRTVLDIGAYDGFYSFAAERLGASRVVAVDHYVWALDLARSIERWRAARARGKSMPPPEETDLWRPDELPGKLAFDTAHKALKSKVEVVVGDFMSMDLSTLGTFDVTLFLGGAEFVKWDSHGPALRPLMIAKAMVTRKPRHLRAVLHAWK
jgi:tRNA (mo5U34)-methyltransferase